MYFFSPYNTLSLYPTRTIDNAIERKKNDVVCCNNCGNNVFYQRGHPLLKQASAAWHLHTSQSFNRLLSS